MRSFRNDRENLHDMRIAYVFLLSLALVCVVLGFTVTTLGKRLHTSELSGCYRSLNLCADALDSWASSTDAAERYGAALRFEAALSGLPVQVELAPLSALSADMVAENVTDAKVRTYAETFALLSSLEYTDAAEAQSLAAKTLAAVHEAVGGVNQSENQVGTTAEASPEALRYSRKYAKTNMSEIFGTGASALDLQLADDSSAWYAETDNLRMTFSPRDGRLEGFIYIRLGSGVAVKPEDAVDEAEQLAAALDFFNSTRRSGKCTKAVSAGEFCGFILAEMESGDELYRAAVDEGGRVWSLMKVKR